MRKCKGTMRDGIYNCYGIYNSSMCYECIHNAGDEEKSGSHFKSYKSAIEELFEWMKGEERPEGTPDPKHKLSSESAFCIIHFLQEHMGCLPSNIEICQECEQLFDADSEGYYLTDEYGLDGGPLPDKYHGHYCDYCVPNIEFTTP